MSLTHRQSAEAVRLTQGGGYTRSRAARVDSLNGFVPPIETQFESSNTRRRILDARNIGRIVHEFPHVDESNLVRIKDRSISRFSYVRSLGYSKDGLTLRKDREEKSHIVVRGLSWLFAYLPVKFLTGLGVAGISLLGSLTTLMSFDFKGLKNAILDGFIIKGLGMSATTIFLGFLDSLGAIKTTVDELMKIAHR